jgi:hypothetical protein
MASFRNGAMRGIARGAADHLPSAVASQPPADARKVLYPLCRSRPVHPSSTAAGAGAPDQPAIAIPTGPFCLPWAHSMALAVGEGPVMAATRTLGLGKTNAVN